MSAEVSAHLVFVGGLSGSGKSTAMAALEDLSFYCVDNLPGQLVPQFLDLCAKATPVIDKIAIAVNAREQPFLHSFPEVVKSLREQGAWVEVLFLDCSDDVLMTRYRETRRVHPLSPEGGVEVGITRERKLLAEFAGLADLVIDTTQLNVHQLKERIVHHIAGRARPTVVNMISFGFRYGTPDSVELLFDMRFLPNPHFEEGLRSLSGRDAAVAAYVLDSERGREFFARLRNFVGYLLPMYDEEGKAYLSIGIGCTGGRHRSVAVAEALTRWLRELGREVNLEHRDVGRGE